MGHVGTPIPTTHRVTVDVAVSFLALFLAELRRGSLVLVTPSIISRSTTSRLVLPIITLIPVKVVVLAIILLCFLPVLVALLGLPAMEALLAVIILV